MKKNASLLMPCLLAAALVLAGCATRTPAPVVGSDGQPVVLPTPAAKDTYTVKSGDTLYSIAREHGMDHRELIAMNGIENPNYITVGRVLKIKPKGAATQPPARWSSRSRLLSRQWSSSARCPAAVRKPQRVPTPSC